MDGAPLDALTPEALGATEVHVRNIHHLLRNAELLMGTNGSTIITLKGLEYLESSRMQAIAHERKPYGYNY